MTSREDPKNPADWAFVAQGQCLGITQYGRRCMRIDPRFIPDLPDSEYEWMHRALFLCRDHLDQAGDAWEVHKRLTRDFFDRLALMTDQAVQYNAQLAAATTSNYVYFMSDGHWMKIGTSIDPVGRLQTLKSRRWDGTTRPGDLNHDGLSLLATIPGGHAVETVIHGIARQWRHVGEWFEDCDDLRSRLALHGISIQTGTPESIGRAS